MCRCEDRKNSAPSSVHNARQRNRRYQTSPAVCNSPLRSLINSSKRLPLSCARCCMAQSNSLFIGALGLSGHMFSSKIAPSLSGTVTPRNILFLGSSPLITPNGISIGSVVFLGSKCYVVQCIVSGKKTPKLPLPLGFRHPAGGGQSYGHITLVVNKPLIIQVEPSRCVVRRYRNVIDLADTLHPEDIGWHQNAFHTRTSE